MFEFGEVGRLLISERDKEPLGADPPLSSNSLPTMRAFLEPLIFLGLNEIECLSALFV